MKKSKKTQKMKKKWRLLIEKISNRKTDFSKFSMILYWTFAQKKKSDSTFFFFFIFTFLCRLLIQRNPKIRLQASIQTIFLLRPFSFDSYIWTRRERWGKKRDSIASRKVNFSWSPHWANEKKKCKKKSELSLFFLVSLQLEIDTKSEKLTFQFEIWPISNRHFFCVFRVFWLFFLVFTN